jgi:hypothetical protein
LNYNKYYSQLLDAFDQQEQKKMAKGGQYNDQLNKYWAGDIFNPDDPPTDQNLHFGDAAREQATIARNNPTSWDSTWQDYGIPAGKTNVSNPNGPFDWGGALETAGSMLPAFYNLGQGLFGKRQKLNANRYNNPYAGQIGSLMANRTYDINPELSMNNTTYRTTAANMRNLGGSRGQVMSNITGAQNAKMFADASSLSQKKQAENQYAAEYAAMLYPLGRDMSINRMNVDEGNLMTDAAGRNMTAAGLSDVQKYLLYRRQMKNQAAQGKLLANAIRAYSPYADKWVPGMDEYLNRS